MAHTIEMLSTADRPDSQAGASAAPNCRRLFSIEQAADHAGEPIEVIVYWINTGRLKAYRLAGGTRIDEVELAHFLASSAARYP